ncbi:MAG: hypothetical protein KatS3mg015_2848 [Fimbriimonadales bacterium]|nr:MAG: hypothetical protein KatS3mg015_2848 [Fimbriimonadales bacterium]
MTATSTSAVPATRPAPGLVAGQWTTWHEPIVPRTCALCRAAIYGCSAVCIDCSTADALRVAEDAAAAYGLAGRAYAARIAPAFYGPEPRPAVIVTARRPRRGSPVQACAVYADGTALGWRAHNSVRQWFEDEGVPAGARLKVLWVSDRADALAVAAELDRLGLPHYRRVCRW